MTYWEVGDNNDIRVWEDAWINPRLKLISKLQNQNYVVDPNSKVATLVYIDGDWNLRLMRTMFDSDTLAKIKVIPPPNTNTRVSSISTYGGIHNRSFTTYM